VIRYMTYRIDPRLSGILADLDGTSLGQALSDRLTQLVEVAEPTPQGDELRAALHPHLWFLGRAMPDGLPLTQAGYLRPADVKATAEVLPAMQGWIFPVTREVHAQPVGMFHHHLRDVGLLRASKGSLQVTKTGRECLNDPDRLWRQLASRLVTRRRSFDEMAALLIALHAATGRVDTYAIARTLTQLGWSRPGGRPVPTSDVQWAWNDLWGALGNVGSRRSTETLDRSLSAAAVSLVRDALLVPTGSDSRQS
jgi:hypothetical protein